MCDSPMVSLQRDVLVGCEYARTTPCPTKDLGVHLGRFADGSRRNGVSVLMGKLTVWKQRQKSQTFNLGP